jgi:mannosyltransferase OCH1-like enzyme
MFYEIPKKIIRNINNPNRIIPYTIYQTFKTNLVPKSMYDSAKSYIDINTNYDYIFYDDDDILNLLQSFNCDDLSFSHDDLLKAYNSMNIGAAKSDIFRYVILYRDGGCYFDIDTVCVNHLDTFILQDDEIVSGIGGRCDLHQWGMIYSKNHPFIKKVLENSISNILNKTFIKGYNNLLEGLTGPPCLDISIKQVLDLPLDYKFKKGIYNINIYQFHILNGDYFDNNIKFKYDNYMNDLKIMNVKYWNHTHIYK